MSSSILNESPRLQIRTRDNRPGSNPSIINSFGDGRTGVRTVQFDDTNTVIFHTGSQITYPEVLHQSSAYVSSTHLITTGRVVKGVSDTVLLSFANEDTTFKPYNETHLPEQSEDSFYLTGTSEEVLPGFSSPLKSKTIIRIDISTDTEQVLTRYSDARGTVEDPSGRFAGQDLTGFVYYNPNVKRWEQIGLVDPATGKDIHYDFAAERNAGSNSSDVISGTGNFPLQFTPEPGGPLAQMATASNRAVNEYSRIGTPTVSCFAPFSNKYHATASQIIRLSDYIQHPFLLEKAVVKIPIEAEKVSNHFFNGHNFRAAQDNYVFFIYRQERNHFPIDRNGVLQPLGGGPSPGKNNLDSPSAVSSSQRYIVLSASLAFYNRTGAAFDSSDDVFLFEPNNSPVFQYEWGVDPFATGTSTHVVGEFTGSVELRAIPAVASSQATGFFRVTRAVNSLSTTEQTRIYNYWPGGTSAFPFGPSLSHGKGFHWMFRGGLYDSPAFGLPTFGAYADPNEPVQMSFGSAKKNLPIEVFDPRAQKILGGKNDGNFVSGVNVTSNAQQSVRSPYLLMPDDELIFGFDAGIGYARNGMQHTNLTGSLMKIKPGEAQVILYGSLTKNGQEFHQGINQDLTSENVSEYLHFDNPTVDQFKIVPKERVAGSTRDYVIFGNMFVDTDSLNVNNPSLNSRRAYYIDSILPRNFLFQGFRAIYDYRLKANQNTKHRPTGPLSGTDLYDLEFEFARGRTKFTVISAENERFYDTLMPSVPDYLTSQGFVTTGAYVRQSTPYSSIPTSDIGNPTIVKYEGPNVIVGSNNFVESKANFLEQGNDKLSLNIFGRNPDRFVSDPLSFLVVSRSVPFGTEARSGHAPSLNVTYQELLITHQPAVKFLVFSRGYRGTTSTLIGFTAESNAAIDSSGQYHNKLHHGVSGSTGYKYGVQGIRPRFSRVTFRPDRYGQFRDMLEQRKDGVFFDTIGISHKGRMTGKTGKRSGPVKVRFKIKGRKGFVKGSTSTLSGSSNRSNAATSSIPYDDGNFSNWDTVF